MFLFHINQQIKVQPNKILIGESVAFDNKHNGIQTAKDNRDIRRYGKQIQSLLESLVQV